MKQTDLCAEKTATCLKFKKGGRLFQNRQAPVLKQVDACFKEVRTLFKKGGCQLYTTLIVQIDITH